MRAVAPLLTLVCGVLVLVGLLMPWYHYSIPISGDMNVSGWNFISHSGGGLSDFYGSILAMGLGSGSEWLALIGGILLTTSALAAFLILLLSNRGKQSVVLLGAVALVGAVLAIIGPLKYIFSDMDVLSLYSTGSLLGKGVYISTAFAFVGAMCALTMFLQARTRLGRQPSDIMTHPLTPSTLVREYYESKAAQFASESVPVAEKPAVAPIPPVSATAPLPPLPPVVDDMAAQWCFACACEFEKTGERDKAIEEYTKTIRLNSRCTTAYFQRGMLLMGMGFKPAAVADFRRVIDLADNPELANTAKEQIARAG